MDVGLTFTKHHKEQLANANGPVTLTFKPSQLHGKTQVRLNQKQAILYQAAVATHTPLTLKLTKKQAGGFIGPLLAAGARIAARVLPFLGKQAVKHVLPAVAQAATESVINNMAGTNQEGSGIRKPLKKVVTANLVAEPAAAGDVAIGAAADPAVTLRNQVPTAMGYQQPPVMVRSNPIYT